MNTQLNVRTLGRRTAAVCALIVAGIALLVLGTWLAGRWQMGTLGSDFIPMAPSTALLFLLLGAAVFIRAREAGGRAGAWFCFVAVGVALATGASRFAQVLLGFDLPLEQWLAPTDTTLKGITVGRMSPMTALAFVLASGALLLQSPALAGRAAARYVARVLTLVMLLSAGTVLVSYGSGAPLLYGGGLVPMALPTAIAFILLGASLLAISARAPLPELQSPPRRTGWWAVTICAMVGGAAAVTGWFYFRAQIGEERGKVEATLNAIADLKVRQISQWRQERYDDATFFGQAPFVGRDVQAFFNDRNPAAKTELIRWLTLLKSDQYSRVALFDVRGELRLMLPDDEDRPVPMMHSHVSDVLRDPRVQMTDLHRGDSGDIHINLAIPIFARATSTIDAKPSALLAVILLEIDPYRFLYPLIQSWPTSSRTAENLLVRRDGDDALYLNELRHRTNTALLLRVPLTRTELPAVRGALGQVGTFETMDYRGVPVLATVRAVPDMPWFMVSKVDQEEIYAPLREKAWGVGLVGMVFVLVGGLGLILIWRGRETEHLRYDMAQRSQAEDALRASERLYRTLVQTSPNAITMTDLQGKITFASQGTLELHGFERMEDIVGRTALDLIVPEDHERAIENLQRTLLEGSIHEIEYTFVRRDGSRFPATLSSSAVLGSDGNPVAFIATTADITDRKRAEAELRKSEEQFREIAETINEVFWVGAADWSEVYYVSPAYERIWGRTVQSLYEQPLSWLDALYPDDREVVRLDIDAKSHGRSATPDFTPYRIVRADGSIRWIFARAFPILNPDGKPMRIVGIAEDITERKRVEEALQREKDLAQQYLFMSGLSDRENVRKGMELGADDYLTKPFTADELLATVEARFAKQREMAEKAEKKLNELRSSISFALPHELRTPLASILGFAQVLSDDPNSLTLEEIAQAARVIQKAGTRLQRLLENFLIYTRIQVAMQEPKQLSALRIAGILHSRELISSTAQRRAGLWNRLVDLKTDLVYSPVAVSEEHFVKIVEELVDNAFKFSVLGSEVRLSTSITNEHFELTITDHGRGMTAQQLADVGAYMQFGRKFYEQQGAGLGLAIVKGLTEIHGGKLEFGNTTGGGLTLRLILPVYPAERRAQT